MVCAFGHLFAFRGLTNVLLTDVVLGLGLFFDGLGRFFDRLAWAVQVGPFRPFS